MSPLELDRHLYAIRAMGFTRVPAQVVGRRLEDLRALADRGLDEARRVFGLRGKLNFTVTRRGFECCRCLYTWGDAALQLLDLDTIHAIAQPLLDDYRLWDQSVISVTPQPPEQAALSERFHRDTKIVDARTEKPPYLWCFICLDDTTPENGATRVVPGSHHLDIPRSVAGESFQAFVQPMAQQLCADAGDLIVFDPTLLHSAGHNTTDRPRRIINVALCSRGTPPLMDHWAIAGAAVQSRLADRVRAMMRSDSPGLGKTWDALPPGWPPAGVAGEGTLSR
ncbi:MAG: phytanoyl-CoA dioxygenase family protein [Planctomycetes bacterium]|nr:phytanoyl-CoA dioxygenase family protein [Planctomycetota bacterium]